MGLCLYNTATRVVEEFAPLSPPRVTMYNCGPTVYNYIHVGNLRPYVFADVLRRTLAWEGYAVEQIINITDVGHLVGDNDDGEDKMTQALKREGKPMTKEAMHEVGEFYTQKFKEDLALLGTLPAAAYPKASDNIAEDIALIQALEEKGFAYRTTDGVYFHTQKFPRYPDFARLDIPGMIAGARVDVGEKKNPTDFALWKFDEVLGYDAPIGRGFPGWHIECSAMAMKYLGETLDIHTGGVDHIPVHHTNEIAQSESVTGKPFAQYWLHNAHVLMDGEKMSKSLGNTYRLIDLHERGIPPLAYRYWLLTAHYRTQVNFTWEALAGAQSAYNRLTNFVLGISVVEGGMPLETYMNEFTLAIEEDMNTASAIALIWKLTKDTSASQEDKYATLMEIDSVLGLGLSNLHNHLKNEEIPKAITELADERTRARAQNDFVTSDLLREKIKSLGYNVKDSAEGQKLSKI